MTQSHDAALAPAAAWPFDGVTRLFEPLGRVLISAIFLSSGIGKLSAYAGTQGYMEAMGVPGSLLPLVIALEIIAPVAIILGSYARSAAFVLAGFTVLSALIFHFNFADQMQSIMFMKNAAITGGLLFIVARGPGAYSLGSQNR